MLLLAVANETHQVQGGRGEGQRWEEEQEWAGEGDKREE